MKIYLLPLFLSLLFLPALAQEPAQPYPADPNGQIIDRAQTEVWTGNKQVFFYAVLYNRGEQGYFDLYKGGPWKKIATLPITFQDESVKIENPSVLQMETSDNTVFIHWDSFIGYQEGAVNLSYVYDRSTGKIKMQWSD